MTAGLGPCAASVLSAAARKRALPDRREHNADRPSMSCRRMRARVDMDVTISRVRNRAAWFALPGWRNVDYAVRHLLSAPTAAVTSDSRLTCD